MKNRSPFPYFQFVIWPCLKHISTKIPIFAQILLAAIITLLSSKIVACGDDLSTTNSDRLAPFWEAAENTNAPVTVVSFGDSMADPYRSITFCLMNQLQGRLGVAGFSLGNYQNKSLCNFTNGAQFVGPSAYWFAESIVIPPQGAAWWETQTSGGLVVNTPGFQCDRLGLFYVSQPSGGLISLSVSSNAGPWVPTLLINTYSSDPIGGFTNIDLPFGFYRLRVDGISGTNIVLGDQKLNRQSIGLHAAFTDYPGIALGEVTNVPLSIRIPIFKALAPNLIVWHMKEEGSDVTRDRIVENEQWWSNAIPQCAILYIGTPYASADTNFVSTPWQNALVRSIALSYNRAYVDCMTPSVSYPWLLTNGFMADETHLNVQGNQYLENFAWNDLGLFALREPRRLEILPGLLRFQTAIGILYNVEVSYDLIHWQTAFSVNGAGNLVSTNLPPAPLSFFRLSLKPD